MDLLASLRSRSGLRPAVARPGSFRRPPGRRLVVAVLVGVAVLCGLTALRPKAVATRAIWVAARDLPGGAPLAAGQLRVERLAVADVPTGVIPAGVVVTGRLLATPMRAGEPLTDVRLLTPALLGAVDAPADVAVPVRLADGPAALALVHAGDRVDILAAGAPGGTDSESGDPGISTSTLVARDVLVLSTPTPAGGSGASGTATGDDAGLLIVAASPHQAAALAQAATAAQLSAAVRRPAS